MSDENSTRPSSFLGASPMSAIPALAAALGSIAKYARATMRSYGPAAPNAVLPRRSVRSTSSTRVTAACDDAHKTSALSRRAGMLWILRQRRAGLRAQAEIDEFPAKEFGERGGGDHSRVVGAEPGTREEDRIRKRLAQCCLAQPGVAGHATGDDQAASLDLFRRSDGAAQQLIDHGLLERCEQIERALRGCGEELLDIGAVAEGPPSGDLAGHVVLLHPAQDGRFQAAEAEVERVALHFRQREAHGLRIAAQGELVDDRASGIAVAQ